MSLKILPFIVLTNDDGDRFLLRADLIFRVTPRTIGMKSTDKECPTTVEFTDPCTNSRLFDHCRETVDAVHRKLSDLG